MRPAIVFLRDGRGFEGQVSIDDGFVHFDGKRRTNTGDHVIYHPVGGRTWPRREIREIRWAAEASEL
jgi:hypothetical protein